MEDITDVVLRFKYFPRRFTWRGNVYDVDSVTRCWTERNVEWFEVRTTSATLYTLKHAISQDAWQIVVQ